MLVPTDPFHVFIPGGLSDHAIAVLTGAVDPCIVLGLDDPGADAGQYRILVSGRPKREQLEANPDLQAVIVPWAGVPPETRTLVEESFPHLTVHNLHHNADATAEMAFALLLAAAKFIVHDDRALRRHDWTPRYEPSRSLGLAGKTALVLGYGAIGQRVARMCRGMDMRVLATKRTATQVESPAQGIHIHPPQDLSTLLPQADAVIVCLPQTTETTGLLGGAELALLPPGAVLANIGRGPIVDQAALYAVLASGHLRAAGLDVWYNYPETEESRTHTPPADFPFHELDNVVMTPHRGGALEETETETLRMQALAHLLNTAAQGSPMPNRVDLGLGY